MEYTLNEIELIDVCLTAVDGYPAPLNLTSKFSDSPAGTQDRVQAFMVCEGLITLTDGNLVGKKYAVITDEGTFLKAKYRSFRKYLDHVQASENEIKRKTTEAEKLEARNTKANEKNATWTFANTVITFVMLMLAAFACWQTSRANDKDRVIEIQKQHMQQLQDRIKK